MQDPTVVSSPSDKVTVADDVTLIELGTPDAIRTVKVPLDDLVLSVLDEGY